jgi:hypothetical protein
LRHEKVEKSIIHKDQDTAKIYCNTHLCKQEMNSQAPFPNLLCIKIIKDEFKVTWKKDRICEYVMMQECLPLFEELQVWCS